MIYDCAVRMNRDDSANFINTVRAPNQGVDKPEGEAQYET